MSCQKYFEISHKTEEIEPIKHPNQYFEKSKRILNYKNTSNVGGNTLTHIKIEMTQ